jgi:hypothetical protein
MRRLLILAAMTLSALASELGGAGHRCAWSGMPRTMRPDKRARNKGGPGAAGIAMPQHPPPPACRAQRRDLNAARSS